MEPARTRLLAEIWVASLAAVTDEDFAGVVRDRRRLRDLDAHNDGRGRHPDAESSGGGGVPGGPAGDDPVGPAGKSDGPLAVDTAGEPGRAGRAGVPGRLGHRRRGRPGGAAGRLPRGVRRRLPEGARLRGPGGLRTPEGREEFRRYFESRHRGARPGDRGRSARSPASHGVHLVVGVIERDGGTLYCTALFFGPDGSLLGKHRKLMPTAMERVVWGQGDGSTLPVVDTPARQGRRGDLLGELHAAAADGDVRQGGRALLRPHRGRPRHLAADHAAHRPGGPLLRAVGLPVPDACATARPATDRRSGRRPGRRAHPGRQLHRRPARAGAGRAGVRARSAS